MEAIVSAAIAALAGLAAITTRINNRILDLDHRLDGVELRIAQNYVPRSELTVEMAKIENHMIRIEQKIDQLTIIKS
jgi:hypothetical protein